MSGWTQTRDLAPLPDETFRTWWAKREKMVHSRDGEAK